MAHKRPFTADIQHFSEKAIRMVTMARMVTKSPQTRRRRPENGGSDTVTTNRVLYDHF